LLEIGVGSIGDDLDGDEADLALRFLVGMVDAFQADVGLLEFNYRVPFACVPNQQARTIGPTGDFVYAGSRPLWIASMMVTPVGEDVSIPVLPYSPNEWADQRMKSLTSEWPWRYHYEKYSATLGRFEFWPIPTTAAVLTIGIPFPLTTPVTLDTDLAFRPGGYLEAWRLNLAKRLVRPFERAVEPANLREDAEKAINVIRNMNHESPDPVRFDGSLTTRGGYDIISNQYQAK